MAVEKNLDAAIVGPAVQRAPDKFYPSIQGLRGFAAFSVIFVHIYLMSSHAGFFPDMPSIWVSILDTLGCSTGLFFVISGFVIPASLFRHRDMKRFFIDRIFRIMPVYVVLHLLVFIIGPFLGYKWLRGIGVLRYLELFFTNLTFTALPLHLPLAQQNSWTLTFEWAFYIFVAIAWVILGRANARRSTMIAIGAVVLVTCFFFPVGWGFVLGMVLNRFRPTWHMSRLLEVLLVPASVVLFYGIYQHYGPFFALPFATVIFWAVFQDGSFTSRLLCLRGMQFLGTISYSLYLVHPIVMFALELFCQRLVQHGVAVATAFTIFAVLSLVTTPFVAAACYELLEVRLRRFLVDRMKQGKGSQPSLRKPPKPVESPMPVLTNPVQRTGS